MGAAQSLPRSSPPRAVLPCNHCHCVRQVSPPPRAFLCGQSGLSRLPSAKELLAPCCQNAAPHRAAAEKAAQELYGKLIIKGTRLRLSWGKPQQVGARGHSPHRVRAPHASAPRWSCQQTRVLAWDQHAACSMQRTTQQAARNMHHSTHNVQRATCAAIHSAQRATCAATHNMQRATCAASHNAQHAARATPLTTRLDGRAHRSQQSLPSAVTAVTAGTAGTAVTAGLLL